MKVSTQVNKRSEVSACSTRKTIRKRVESLYKAEAGQLSRDYGVPLLSEGKQNTSA